jgi:hypothetical protein
MTNDGTVRGRASERPTGIIRTLPSLYGQRAAFAASVNSREESIGAKRYRQSMKLLEAGKLEAIYIALQAIPRFDVLHLYLLIDGRIDARLNIAGYEPGDSRKCWDETIRKPKYWAVCTTPVSRPPEPLLRRGFQGMRYTEDLW